MIQNAEGVVDFDANTQIMSKVFVKEVKKSPGLMRKTEGSGSNEQLHCIVDPKRAQNMAIVVLRFKVSIEVR